MKKIIKILAVLSFFSAIVACNNQNTTSSSTLPPTSSIVEENPTRIDIAGASFVEVTKTIPLVADVVTSIYDDVTWSSENESVASINESGIVTGIAEGSATIRATSVKYPELTATHEVQVTVPKITSISLFVEGNDNITEDSQTNFYNVPLGQIFYVNYKLTPANGRIPDSISYEVLVNGNVAADTNAYSLEIQEDNRAKVVFYDIIQGVEIVVNARYGDYFNAPTKSSRVFNVFDPNKENKEIVISKINEFKEVEQNLLASSLVTKEKTVKTTLNGVSTSSYFNENIEHFSFTNSSYLRKTKNNNTTFFYHGVNNDQYYAFEYDNNQNITQLFDNTSAIDNDFNKLSSLYFDIYSSSLTYGHSGILNNYLTSSSTIEDNIITFGNSTCYAYSSYNFSDTQYIITSNYIDDNSSIPYTLSLTINLDEEHIVSGYIFEETVILTYNDNGKEIKDEITYTETASNFIFKNKNLDVAYENKIDISQYYFDSFELIDLSGKKLINDNNTSDTSDDSVIYDYSNTSKYGADYIENENGLKKFITTYNKTLVFKVQGISPSTATTYIDRITSASSNPDSIPNIDVNTEGIITINAKKDDDGNSLPGLSTFTFTSTLGYKQQIVIEFTKPNLTGLVASNINEDNDLGTIFKGELSSYFFLNTVPDEDIYSFDLTILSGPENGISLYDFDDNNIDKNPGFSFAIEGHVVGSYSFKFFAVEDKSIKTEQIYTITVVEPYSNDYLVEHLVSNKKVYSYSTGVTQTFDIEFTSENLLTFTQTAYDVITIETINYEFVEGKIIVTDTQYFDQSGFYFSKILGSKCPYNEDLSEICFYLQRSGDLSYIDSTGATIDFFNKYIFEEKLIINDLSDFLNGKELQTQDFITDAGMCTITISFSENHAYIVFVKNSDSSIFAEINMDYSIDEIAGYTYINISNTETSNNKFTRISSLDYIETMKVIRFTYEYKEIRSVLDFELN